MKYAGCFVSLLLLASCLDLSERQIVGPYFVAADPAGPYETLYYALPNGLLAERIRNVEQVGYSADFLFIKSADQFYYLNRAQDRPTDIGDPAVQRAISKPLTAGAFRRALDSLGVKDFRF